MCGSAKSQSEFVCGACARACVDPDHKEKHYLEVDSPMCPFCAGWLVTLDLSCGGKPSSCTSNVCSVEPVDGIVPGCKGKPLLREGFFVYQLETGYVGMTYNPSLRQFQHEVVAKNALYMAGRNDIRNPGAYSSRVVEYRSSEFVLIYDEHWKKVRNSDTRNRGEHRIRWLSPPLDSRQTAWRCEWALKAYKQERAVFGAARFAEVTSVSAVPLLALKSAGLSFDPENQNFLFGLKWGLSGDLGPRQILPTRAYELESWDSFSGSWAAVETVPGVPCSCPVEKFSDGSVRFECVCSDVPYSYEVTDLSGLSVRVRGISDVGIPGPWALISLTEEELVQAVSSVLGLSPLRAAVRPGSGMVDLSWSLSCRPDGVVFEVVRYVSSLSGFSEDEVFPETEGVDFVDQPLVPPLETFLYEYRVRARWRGYSTPWHGSSVQVKGAFPGAVRSLSLVYQRGDAYGFSWEMPVWSGYSPVTHFEVQHHAGEWQSDRDVSVGGRSGAFSTMVGRSLVAGARYRVRAVNGHGWGPWVELDTAGGVEAVRRGRRQSFQVGQEFSSRVSSITEHGAFVSLGVVDGLVPSECLSMLAAQELGELSVGDPVVVRVTSVDGRDPEKGNVRLTLPCLRDPWDFLAERHSVGDVIVGVYDGLADFGIFVRFELGLKGLVHKTEIPPGEDWRAADAFAAGQVMKVRICSIDVARQRLGLSLLGL